jgi:hypothetical protein
MNDTVKDLDPESVLQGPQPPLISASVRARKESSMPVTCPRRDALYRPRKYRKPTYTWEDLILINCHECGAPLLVSTPKMLKYARDAPTFLRRLDALERNTPEQATARWVFGWLRRPLRMNGQSYPTRFAFCRRCYIAESPALENIPSGPDYQSDRLKWGLQKDQIQSRG